MMIDYQKESVKYRPRVVRTLLIGEAPPANGKSYFYVPCPMKIGLSIENDRSLPATIFHHYFQERPTNIETYVTFLRRLQEAGIFLIDICDDPIRVQKQQGDCS